MQSTETRSENGSSMHAEGGINNEEKVMFHYSIVFHADGVSKNTRRKRCGQ